ncbi:hypothetical protein KIN20_031140 [Parelaphostrongylus tenuis]|uniref:Uncharacterized protein n=1 Tax=Parelaphostrongylus tenuis TaxID=148309 RepID=A0AAD5R4R0_PARTN|nr:hypothetical protein KIN20_031140 [Parelaphostrongylus tenuis]
MVGNLLLALPTIGDDNGPLLWQVLKQAMTQTPLLRKTVVYYATIVNLTSDIELYKGDHEKDLKFRSPLVLYKIQESS